jgi:hypothetical protein
MIPNLKPELMEMIQKIGTKSLYYGNKIPDSVLSMLTIEETDLNCGILAPYWFGVFQRGRGPSRSNTDWGLKVKIYQWMQNHNMFESKTEKGKINEARFMALYINKYGNAHFRSKRFVDVYDSARKETIKKIEDKFSFEINKITMQIL